jgi:hypothetical protein
VNLWKQREPEYARRRAKDVPEGAAASPMLQRAEAAAAEEAAPETPVDAIQHVLGGDGDAEAKRERRRQRRKSRPHGRAR